MAEMVKAVAPMAYKSFETHSLNAVTFSGKELQALKDKFSGKEHNLKGIFKTEYEKKIEKILTQT